MKHIFKGLFGYLLSLAMAVVFALYLSGRVGWFLVLAFVLAPVFSLLLAWSAGRHLHILASPDADMVSKGDVCRIHMELHNRSVLPTPSVQITVRDSVTVRCGTKCYLASVMPFGTEAFDIDFKAGICGSAVIGVDSIAVRDYFGIASFAVSSLREHSLRWEIGVIPEVSGISERDERISRLVTASMQADSSEDTVETVTTTLMGFPGYEDREYVPGDPLKRINWKLSAKRGQLLVRLDDETPGLSVNIVLDSVFDSGRLGADRIPPDFAGLPGEEQVPMIAQAAVEDSLGLVQMLMEKNYTVVYYVRDRRRWESFPMMREQDLSELRGVLAHYSFAPGNGVERMPYEELLAQGEGLTVCCTPFWDRALDKELAVKAGGRDFDAVIYPIAVQEGGEQYG